MEPIPLLLPPVPTATALALAVALVALVVAARQTRRTARLESHYRAVMTGVDGADLAAALEAQAARLVVAERRLGRLEAGQSAQVARLGGAIQRVRLVRYSAFEDAGGDQSFALALLDDASAGVVISGLYGRGGMRVYAKPVVAGRSAYQLTAEEAQAIREAGRLEAPAAVP